MEMDIDLESQTSTIMYPPITLKFKDILYKVKTSKKKHAEGKHQMVLNGVTGTALPGEMLVILGPSGSGKTTLLKALGSRLEGDLSGTITYNGRPFSSAIKHRLGFVTQREVLYPHLTVRETLVYAALLRLPSTLSREDRVRRAESVITQLGLGACMDSIIGGQLLRGVSGGERKRVCIGQELLIDPVLLLLDEPTTGLDSTTAQKIVSTLSEFAKMGRTVAMSIHQPSGRLFYMFQKILVLSGGHPIYFGKRSEALDYFASIGHSPSVVMNPAEFLLDLANGVSFGGLNWDRNSMKQALISAYGRNINSKLKEDLQGTHDSMEFVHDRGIRKWATTWREQFEVLLQRDLKERGHEALSLPKIFRVLPVAFITGLLWWRSGVVNLRDQTGLLYFTASFWCTYTAVQAVLTFQLERRMLIKERTSSMYRLSAYFMARMVADLPLELALPSAFVTISYWMGGLKPVARSFVEALLALLLEVLVSQAVGLALGAFITNSKSAATLASIIMLSSNLVGGYFVQHIPAFVDWTKYLSVTHHTYKLLVGTQYTIDQTYVCAPDAECLVRDFPSVKIIGPDKKWVPVLAMFVMFMGYRLIAYIGLMRIHVKKAKAKSTLACLKLS